MWKTFLSPLFAMPVNPWGATNTTLPRTSLDLLAQSNSYINQAFMGIFRSKTSADVHLRPPFSAGTVVGIMSPSCGYGFTLIREGTPLDEELTIRPIAGVDWAVNTAVIYHKQQYSKTVPILIKKFRRQLRNQANGGGQLEQSGELQMPA
jgi:hypothetical protein